MEPIYRQSVKIENAHADACGRLKISSLLYLVQEAAGEHARLLGTDWDTLQTKRLFWAILRHRVQVDRLPKTGETVTLETWPMPTSRVAYPRATAAYDADGNLLFRTTAIWVLMDTVNRTMVLPGKSGVEVIGTVQGNELPAPASIVPAQLPNRCRRTVTDADLDRNRHMNNARYLDWVTDLLPEENLPRELNLCYLAEATKGQTLTLSWEQNNDGIFHLEACREKTDLPGTQERVFAARVQL